MTPSDSHNQKKKVEIFSEKSSIEKSKEVKTDIDKIRTSTRRPVKYKTAGKNPVCVICNKEKFDKKEEDSGNNNLY